MEHYLRAEIERLRTVGLEILEAAKPEFSEFLVKFYQRQLLEPPVSPDPDRPRAA